MEAKSVSLSEVRQLTEIAFQLLERSGVTEVVLDKDFHWEIDADSSFKVEEPQPVVESSTTLTSLRQAARELLEGEYHPVWHYLQHLSGIFKALTKQASDQIAVIGLEGSG